jgi:hypothetical protein
LFQSASRLPKDSPKGIAWQTQQALWSF